MVVFGTGCSAQERGVRQHEAHTAIFGMAKSRCINPACLPHNNDLDFACHWQRHAPETANHPAQWNISFLTFMRMVKRSSSEESISSSDITSTSSDDSSSSENGDITADLDGHRSADPDITESSQSSDERKTAGSRRRAKVRPKGRLNVTYKDLVDTAHDDMIPTDERKGIQSTRKSTIWTSREKEVLFRAVARYGQDDVRILAGAMMTKSPLQVRAYLLLCQDASHDEIGLQKSGSDNPLAALEIGRECAEALDLAAESLARHEQCQEIEAEKAKFGAVWLIDEDAAATIETDYLEKVRKEDDQPEDFEDNLESTPTQSLLNPSAFLQLSCNIFMNAAPLSGNNWRDIAPYDEASSSPAVFHSALDVLHQTVVDVARRLVQATLLQATSRIRAKANSNPVAEVKEADVAIAGDLLGLQLDSRKYWASVARRCGLDVYTRSTKYRKPDGDEGHRVKLMYDEVEAELGFPPTARASNTTTTPSENTSISASEDSDTDSITSHGSQISSESHSSHDADNTSDNDEELEMMDNKWSRAEEKRLMQMLMLHPKIESPSDEESLQTSNPKARRRKRRPSNDIPQWRKRVRYEAEWERYPRFSMDDGQHVPVQGNQLNQEGTTAAAPFNRNSKVTTAESPQTDSTSESSDDAELGGMANEK